MLPFLNSSTAAALDRELMLRGAYSIDQLMELAGLAVAQAIYKQYPPTTAATAPPKLLVLIGPGNNGGDGLVCARHLKLWNAYHPIIFYPKVPDKPLFHNLLQQLTELDVDVVSTVQQVEHLITASVPLLIVDSLFGFSFTPPVREPFTQVLRCLAHSKGPPIVSIDIPLGWGVDSGPPEKDAIDPAMLVSLTAPKPCAASFSKDPSKHHYLGGRFIAPSVAKKYHLEGLMNMYQGSDLVVRL